MSERPGTNRFGQYEYTEAERLWLEANFDEVAYLEDVDARILAKRRHPSLLDYDRSVASEAERCQSPDSAA